MNPSLRQRLLLILLSATLLAWTGTAAKNYFDNRREIADLFDAQLAQSARALLALSAHELHEQLAYIAQNETTGHNIPERPLPQIHKYEQRLAFQIWAHDGKLAVRSESAPMVPLATEMGAFRDRVINGQRWRVYALSAPDKNMEVHVGEHYDQREQLSEDVARQLLTAVFLSLPLLALLIWFGVGRAMTPLNRIARAVARRQLGNLEPVDSGKVPAEAKPLVDALNDLFARLKVALDNILHFTADAAHELRTPLAALKTHAQVAARATDNATRQEALQELLLGVDRATALVDQLLTLARLDPESSRLNDETSELHSVAQTVIGELAYEAKSKNIDLSLAAEVRGVVVGKTPMLSILIRNLVENAIRYAPGSGVVEVAILKIKDDIVLRVSDSGPGIPPAERDKVFQRFFRVLGTDAPGSGLGLAIVQRIVEIHNARIELGTSRLGGLQFDVRLRAAPGVTQELPDADRVVEKSA